MKRIKNICKLFLAPVVLIIILGCAAERQYDFSLNNTLSIFMINNENGSFFCIPLQYMGDYHVEKFDFRGGSILIGGYEILLKRDDVNIYVYLNEEAEENGSSINGFNRVYSEEKGKISISKMSEPLTVSPVEDDGKYVHCYIFIEKYLSNDDLIKIKNEYKKGNIYSQMSIEYDLVIDNEAQNGFGTMDDFELYDGIAIDPQWYPPNLNFFKFKYMQN
ncbi:MAG: hypothetical protein FWC22_05675 [Treponema sp.]|nr:hypothetical protein [Treponema sp.]